MLLQHPELHAGVAEFNKISSLDLPGVKILAQMLETLHESPHLNTAALLERARDSQHETHLQQLAQQPLVFEADKLQPELNGIIQQLQQQAIGQRHEYLERKGLRNLTEKELIEYKGLYLKD
jgi:DNA primase